MADSPPPTCWFGTNKPQSMEYVPREGSFDLTVTKCCAKVNTLKDVMTEFKGRHNLYDFESPLDLILFRANGELSFDKDEAASREICKNHLDSLFYNWGKSNHLHKNRKRHCSLPNQHHSGTRPTGNYLINKSQAVLWMEKYGELLHPGIVICLAHKKQLYSEKSNQSISMNADHFPLNNDEYNHAHFDGSDLTGIPISSQEQEDPITDNTGLILGFLASICSLLGISRLLSNFKWCELEQDSKQKKKRAFRLLVTELAKAIAGNNYLELMELTVKDCKCPKDTGDAFLDSISSKYAASTSRKDKMEWLSIVLSVPGISHRKISQVFSVTKHQIRTAIAFAKGLYSIVKYKRVKYRRDRVYEFIRFLARTRIDDNEFDLEDNPYHCSVKNCVKTFTSIEELEIHEYQQSHSFECTKDTMLDTAVKEFSAAIETEECAREAVEQNEMIIRRGDVNTHGKGWALKEGRAPRMNSEVQAVAQKYFFEKRAEGKRASPAECAELIRTMMNEKTDYFRFPLSICPSEKSLTSTFGTWEEKRLRPIAIASKGRGRPKKSVSPKSSNRKPQKRSIGEVDDDAVEETEMTCEDTDSGYVIANGNAPNDESDDEENTILMNRLQDEEIMMSMVEENFEEIFHN